jgi:RNA polymerase sigma factor (sigma-70 family)
MTIHPTQSLFAQACPAPSPALGDDVSDADLLDRFLRSQDEGAFEMLVWRHGPLVLGTCRRVLGDDHNAEDAFQATFFALARKASTIGRRESVSAWLYKVAYRIALRARSLQAKRNCEEPLRQEPPVPAPEPPDDLAARELQQRLDAQIDRLPEKYRAVFVLCHLEGKTNEEAARELGCPKGTILSRLSRARERLRKWLGERGDMLVLAPFGVLAGQAHRLVEVSPVLVHGTVHLAILAPAARLAASIANSRAVDLAESVLHELRRTARKRTAALVVLLLLLLGMALSGSWLIAAGPGSGAPSGQSTSGHCGGR